MKKTICLILFVGLILGFTECKKGKDDPFFSFRTRKNRVVGNWKIETGTTKYTEYSSTGQIIYNELFKFTGTKFEFNNSTAGVYSGTHLFNMNFTKDGNLSINEFLNSFEYNTLGTWDFNSGIGAKKNKEQINIHVLSYQNSSGIKSFIGNQTDITYDIIELRNKKIVLYSNNKVTYPDGTGKSYTESYTMVQAK